MSSPTQEPPCVLPHHLGLQMLCVAFVNSSAGLRIFFFVFLVTENNCHVAVMTNQLKLPVVVSKNLQNIHNLLFPV